MVNLFMMIQKICRELQMRRFTNYYELYVIHICIYYQMYVENIEM